MITLGTGPVYVNNKRETFTLYADESATKHSGADNERLRLELQKALNAPDSAKVEQEKGVFRVKINQGKGYLVYKTNLNDVPNTAMIFHYHENYFLDGSTRSWTGHQ
jgi:putative component of toxin-antitoxin plasmid stabilization module